jgi:hypothetical protein
MALVKPDVSEERIVPIIRVTRIGELGKLAVPSNRSTLKEYYIVIAVVYCTLFLRNVLRLFLLTCS